MTFSYTNLSGALENGGAISAEDVLDVRRWVWSDGEIAAAEAEAVFALNRLATKPPREWVDFFVEAITEFVVNQQPPRGYVDEGNANWLMAQIDRDGRVDTLGELELLVKVMDSALNAPQSLKSYALRQIEHTITSGEGPTRDGGSLRPGVIDDVEVTLLRSLIFAGASEGALTVGRDEAETLWRIKDACKASQSTPAWEKLFVQAVGNHLMAKDSYQPLDRTEAQRLEAFVADTHGSVGSFLGRMTRSLAAGGFNLGPKIRSASFAVDETTTRVPDSDWLKQHINADGSLDPLEKALLAFIVEEGGEGSITL